LPRGSQIRHRQKRDRSPRQGRRINRCAPRKATAICKGDASQLPDFVPRGEPELEILLPPCCAEVPSAHQGARPPSPARLSAAFAWYRQNQAGIYRRQQQTVYGNWRDTPGALTPDGKIWGRIRPKMRQRQTHSKSEAAECRIFFPLAMRGDLV